MIDQSCFWIVDSLLSDVKCTRSGQPESWEMLVLGTATPMPKLDIITMCHDHALRRAYLRICLLSYTSLVHCIGANAVQTETDSRHHGKETLASRVYGHQEST